MTNQNKLYRSRRDKMLAGVAGGLGEYLKIDSTIIRIIFVIFFFVSAGIPFLLFYIALAIVIPMEPKNSGKEQEIT